MKKSISLALTLLIAGCFIGLMTLFALGLKNDPSALDWVTKGQKLVTFSLPSLMGAQSPNAPPSQLSNKDLKTNKGYYLLNFWGSWCPACYQEHPYLMQLAQTETIYGVNWKDKPDDGKQFIRQRGNPYKAIIVDNDSKLAINLGVYGAPETYLIAADGTIIYRHTGVLSASVWEKGFLPKINALTALQHTQPNTQLISSQHENN